MLDVTEHRTARLRACVGPDRADDVDRDEQVILTIALLERAAAVRLIAAAAVQESRR